MIVFLSFLFSVAFLIGLKLTGLVGWSWLWILAPIWGPLVLLLVALMVVIAMVHYYS